MSISWKKAFKFNKNFNKVEVSLKTTAQYLLLGIF